MFFYVQSYILLEQFRNYLPVDSVEKEHEAITKDDAFQSHPVW
jgi:hypothetical protein